MTAGLYLQNIVVITQSVGTFICSVCYGLEAQRTKRVKRDGTPVSHWLILICANVLIHCGEEMIKQDNASCWPEDCLQQSCVCVRERNFFLCCNTWSKLPIFSIKMHFNNLWHTIMYLTFTCISIGWCVNRRWKTEHSQNYIKCLNRNLN